MSSWESLCLWLLCCWPAGGSRPRREVWSGGITLSLRQGMISKGCKTSAKATGKASWWCYNFIVTGWRLEMYVCAPESGYFPVKPHGHWLLQCVSVEQTGVGKSTLDKVVLKISEAIAQSLYFWVKRVGNEYELIQAFAFLELLENYGAFCVIESNQCLAGGKQSCIRLHVCCSLRGSPAGPARWEESCQLFSEGASASLQWRNSCCGLPSHFKVQIQWHTVTSQLGYNFIINNYGTC